MRLVLGLTQLPLVHTGDPVCGGWASGSLQGISRSRDKLRSLQLFSRHDIGIPPTAFARRLDPA